MELIVYTEYYVPKIEGIVIMPMVKDYLVNIFHSEDVQGGDEVKHGIP